MSYGLETPVSKEVDLKFSTTLVGSQSSSLDSVPVSMTFLGSEPVTGHVDTPTSTTSLRSHPDHLGTLMSVETRASCHLDGRTLRTLRSDPLGVCN